ncbi:MAG: hypothetical protein ABIA78_00010 [archaeon]
MKLLGFNFTKINVEKISDKINDLQINSKIDILSIEEVKTDLPIENNELIAVKFTYIIDYISNVAKLEFAGNLILSADKKVAKEIKNGWKNKKMPDEFKRLVFNIILRKSNLKAIQLEDDLNIPIHIPLPSIKKEETKTDKL